MKKLTAILLAMGLLCALAVPAMAAQAPVITAQPQNPTYNEYATALYSVTAQGSNLSCTWYLEFEGETYNLHDTAVGVKPWEGYAGETYGMLPPSTNGSFTTFTYHFGGIGPELDGARIYAVVEDGHFEVTSTKSVIRVAEGVSTPPEIKVPVGMEVFQDEVLDLYCEATDPAGGTLSYLWYETGTGKLEDIIAVNRGSEDQDTLRCDTSNTGTRYYVCAVGTSNGGSAYSSVIPVTVWQKSNDPIIFTQGSYSTIGSAMTVDIEAMTDYDARVWNAFLERDVQYQWYLDGTPISGGTAQSLEMLEEYEGRFVHVAVTCYDLVFLCVPFEVSQPTPEFDFTTMSLPEGKVGEEYSFQLETNSPIPAYFEIMNDPEGPNQFDQTGLSLSDDGKLTGKPTQAGDYTFTIFTSWAGGEKQRSFTLTVTADEPPATEPTVPDETDPTVPDETEPSLPTESTQPTTPPAAEENDQPRTGMPWWGIALIAVAGVAFGAAATIFFTSKKK